MRIPIDYYRILGLPPQATPEQIQQAHRDRVLSIPRREYSDDAIASRKLLIDLAHGVLADTAQRQAYDAQILADEQSDSEEGTTPVPIVPVETAFIEIDDRDIVGALLLLYELGEYSRALEIGQSYADANAVSPLADRASYNPDITLTVSLAHLEIGREYWKRGEYEAAARSLETTQELLLREGMFVNIRSEVQSDLFKLRPYRILELLAAPEHKEADHRKGLLLLQEMLDARKGIDGTGNDYSNLSIDDFLRFIQQLRGYMTTLEQHLLFEDEARRPSPVASYLAVYALIARGFSQCQPALIRRAKGMLSKLSNKQDVHLEQAVCALLLGQTEEASKVVELSSEHNQIDFIRENSKDSPDLLPGLCLYSERWLQEEVYPHFRDLANQTASLKDYFADEQVQAYLEELPNASTTGSEWVVSATAGRTASTRSFGTSDYAKTTSMSKSRTFASEQPLRGNTSVLERPISRSTRSTHGHDAGRSLPPLPKSRVGRKEPRKPHASSVKIKRKVQVGRLIVAIAIGVGLVGGLVALAAWGWRTLANPQEKAKVSLERHLAPLSDAVEGNSKVVVAKPGPIDKNEAAKLIESWQNVKSKAMGNAYEIDALEGILAEPVLLEWRSRARELKSSKSYLQYIPKSVEVAEVKPDGEDKARVLAKISETRNFFSNGSLDSSSSKADTSYEVTYDLLRKDDKWMIREMHVSD